MAARGRGATREQRLADARKRLDAAEQELTDLDAAEQFATRRYDVADGRVQEMWDQLETAQREREDAREDRATIRDRQRQVRARIGRLQRRVRELEPPALCGFALAAGLFDSAFGAEPTCLDWLEGMPAVAALDHGWLRGGQRLVGIGGRAIGGRGTARRSRRRTARPGPARRPVPGSGRGSLRSALP